MLNDLRIIEIGEGMAVQVAGLMLCELGADVLKIERPGGDPSRGTAPFANWNRGKRSLELDLATAGLATLRARLTDADVLLHQFTPAKAKALGLDDARLAAAFPKLVVCGVTGSPNNHPDVERSDDELLVAARLGVMYENDGHRAGPIVWRYRAGGWGAAHLAAAGILARLVMRLHSGKGGAAHTSILQGFLSKMPMVWARNSEGPMPNPPTYPLAARPTAMQLFQCKGGDWMQIMDPTQQFDYATLPTMWDVIAQGGSVETPEAAIEAFKQHPIEAWIADLRAADIAVEPAYPMGEVLRHPDVIANGYAIEVDDPALGKTIQPNVPFHTDAPLMVGRAAPRLGEGGTNAWNAPPRHPGEGRDPEPQAKESLAGLGPGLRRGDEEDAGPEHPLSGVRVLDLGMFLAGPMAPSLMGDMGANVIKVEALTGDRIRFMHRYFQCAARSKRSIALDLTKPEAQVILARLIKWAEVLHHNMRFKGADKLGLSESAIRQHNPDIAFSYVSAYGQRGTRGNWPGYDSIFNAIAGWEFENAGAGNKPIMNRPGTMDIHSAQSCLVATMAALYAKRASGKGWGVQTSLLGVSAFSQGERLIGEDGELTETYHLTSDQTGFGPYHRILECAEGGWIAIAAHEGAERVGVRSVLGDDPEGFVDAAKTHTASELLATLEAAGVPCDTVVFEDAMNRFFDDPQSRELGLVSALPQPLYGIIEQPGEMWNFGETEMDITRACPTIGQHSDEIMREMGFSDVEIAGFREAKVIG
jgi:crotonobetainyl-CoA:carnitine CoA-transferase CaiB-like acyl-CoA transferase